MIRALALVLAVCWLSGCVTQRLHPLDPAGVQVIDEAMSSSVLVRSAWIELSRPHGDVVRNSLQFVASVDRQTGATTYAAVHEIEHRLGAWLMAKGIDYKDGDGAIKKGKDFRRQVGSVDMCGIGSCRYRETAMFSLQEDELRLLALESAQVRWEMRVFTAQGYADASGSIVPLVPFMQRVALMRQERQR